MLQLGVLRWWRSERNPKRCATAGCPCLSNIRNLQPYFNKTMGLNRGIPSQIADCVACFEPTLAPEVPRNGVK